MKIKKNFFAPLALGLGATRRAAMLLLVMMLTATTAWAQDPGQPWQCGDHLTWRLTARTLTITGTGAMYDYYDPSKRPWNSYASDIQTVVIGDGVTSIGNNAFYGCTSLTSVTFAEGSQLTSIGDNAFDNCSSMTSITIPASVTSIGEAAFFSCGGLTSVSFAEGSQLESIGMFAFENCYVLTSITIPASVESIGAWAFGVTGLTSIEIPASVTSIGDYAFGCCLNLATVTVYAPSCTLGEDAFDGCEKLANIYVFSDKVASYKAAENWSSYEDKIKEMPNPNGKCGDNVRWVLTGESPNYTLTICGDGNMDYNDLPERPWEEYAEEIRTVVIEIGVESISNNAFQGCSNLATVSFAPCSTLKTIGDGAFQNCHNLTSITIPASVTSIGRNVFHDNLASITVEDGNTVFDSRNGCNAIIVKSTNTLIIGCKNSTIPTGVTSIGDDAFNGCTGLTSIEIPASVTSIGNYAFYTTRLTSIEIPASVTSIGMRAFQNCPNLATVTVYAPSCTLGDKAFLNCSKLENIYVFSDLVDDYQGAENWSDYKSIIKGIGGYCGATDHETDVVWALTGESTNCTLTISGTGAMADYASSSVQPWNDYRSSIKTVVIGNGVTSIGNYTFAKCTGLTSIEIPASVTSIGDNAFWECSNLATVTFAEDSQLATIGISAFSTCRGLASVEIPASVTSIGNNAFSTCNGLGSVTFAEGSQLTSIGNNAFQLCSNLTSITIPASVTSIGSYAFLNCDLASITVADGNTVYDSRNGCNAIIVKSTNTLIIGCKNSTIPASVTSIGERAFYNTGLTSIEIPASVTSIGGSAFYGCSGLTGIEIPASVTNIGGSAFYGCSGLTSIEIPASVTSIRSIAFRNCSNLATVTVYALECSLGEDAFLNCDKLTNIYVFSDKVAFYQGAEHWSAYKDIITALPTVTTSYVDADGTLHEGAVPLNNAMTTLPAGWYVVNSDISYTGTITLNGDVNIILADGKTMTVSGGSTGIYGKGSSTLTIYGQTLGTGTLDVTGTNYGILYLAGNVVIRGGTVNATGTNIIGIYAYGYITITGGQVTATGDEAGIYSDDGNITLGWTSASDFITASSYGLYNSNRTVKIADGKSLSDGTNTYDNQTASATLLALTNVTLTPPTYSVTANRATTEDTEYWSTFYHPAAGYTADENTTVYQAAVNTTTNKVELTAVPGREIPADKAVVLKSTQSAITLSRATTTQTLDGNELKGGATVADGTVPYTLAAKDGTVGFYKFVGAALNPNKAHLEITAPAQSAPAFFGFEENTTAINEHELHESHELSGAWYSLDGRKLSGKPSAKGIYVRNGRKFIIK